MDMDTRTDNSLGTKDPTIKRLLKRTIRSSYNRSMMKSYPITRYYRYLLAAFLVLAAVFVLSESYAYWVWMKRCHNFNGGDYQKCRTEFVDQGR